MIIRPAHQQAMNPQSVLWPELVLHIVLIEPEGPKRDLKHRFKVPTPPGPTTPWRVKRQRQLSRPIVILNRE